MKNTPMLKPGCYIRRAYDWERGYVLGFKEELTCARMVLDNIFYVLMKKDNGKWKYDTLGGSQIRIEEYSSRDTLIRLFNLILELSKLTKARFELKSDEIIFNSLMVDINEEKHCSFYAHNKEFEMLINIHSNNGGSIKEAKELQNALYKYIETGELITKIWKEWNKWEE